MSLGTTNISTTVVGQAIGLGSHNVGALCASTNVNQWSFYKPVSVQKYSGLVDSDYYAVDDGFTIPTYSSPLELINALISGTKWTYNKPAGGAGSPYRLGDFRGYNHTATNWFDMSIGGGSSDVEYSSNRTFSMGVDVSSLLQFNKFAFAKTAVGVLDVGLILVNSWTSTSSGFLYKISDIRDYEQLNMNILNDLSLGVWYAVPVLFTHSNQSNNSLLYFNQNSTSYGTFYLLPANPCTVNIIGSGGGIALGNVTLNYNDKWIDIYGYTVVIHSFQLYIENTNNFEITIYLTGRMSDAMSYGGFDAGNVTIGANSSTYLELFNSDKTYESADGNPVLELTYSYGESTLTTSWEINNL